MNAATYTTFPTLTAAQKIRVWEIWHDGIEPTEYVYELQGAQVIGRLDVRRALNKQATAIDYGLPPELPRPVSSALKDPAPIARRDVLREIPSAMRVVAATSRRQAKPKPKPRHRSPYTRADMLRGFVLIGVFAATWIYLH